MNWQNHDSYIINKNCLGWMSVPRKPSVLGNKYHIICDGQHSEMGTNHFLYGTYEGNW